MHAVREKASAETPSRSERRAFGVHPAIILSLIREQSSSMEKAIAELVMNSVDAGATKVELQLDEQSFKLTDDGRGFGSREQIECVFGIFGLPHQDGDAQYGRFRVGRGQIMAHACVAWHSGQHHMHVDLQTNDASLGYTLTTMDEHQPGCVVEGKFFKNTHEAYWDLDISDPYKTEVAELVRYIDVPVTINGVRINKDASTLKWDYEDEFAWYRFNKHIQEVTLYDRGLRVSDSMRNLDLGRGALIVTKQALKLNMARNEVHWDCPVWNGIKGGLRKAFDVHLEGGAKLSRDEVIDLIKGLINGDFRPQPASRKKILDNRCVEDVFGTFKTFGEMIGVSAATNDALVFSCHEARQSMIAERVQREGHAIVLPEWFVMACYSALDSSRTDDMDLNLCVDSINKLRKALAQPNCFIKWATLGHFSRQLGYAFKLVEEDDLKPEEKVVLDALRAANDRFSSRFTRKIIVGVSQELDGWTDAFSYIAVSRECLMWIREPGGHTRLLTLLMHEYAHQNPSTQEHSHDLSFYERFHSLMRQGYVHLVAEVLFRAYARGMAKAQLQPSKSLRYHVHQMGGLIQKLKPKRGSVILQTKDQN